MQQGDGSRTKGYPDQSGISTAAGRMDGEPKVRRMSWGPAANGRQTLDEGTV